MIELPSIPFDRIDPELAAQVPPRFAVRDAGSANWVVRRIVEARTYAERATAWADAETRRARRVETFFLRRFGPELEAWVQTQLQREKTKARSVSLPAGRLGYRQQGPRLVIADEASVLKWARAECPDAVREAVSLLKTPLTLHFETTGELPPGTSLQPSSESFYVR